MRNGNIKALLPILIFLIVYLGFGFFCKHVFSDAGCDIPIIIFFLIALLVACNQNKKLNFHDKIKIMGQGIGNPNIVTMILIFLEVGIFVGIVGCSSAKSVAYFMLSIVPVKYSIAVIFIIACFISSSIGTSVGTITIMTPIAIAVSNEVGVSASLSIASVIGGAMFGDNLSFISDTTIAACNGQGCKMQDKFRENFVIALPAAIVSVIIILLISFRTKISNDIFFYNYNLIHIIPYIVVFICGVIGVNIFFGVLIGIIFGSIITLAIDKISVIEILSNIETGVSNMFETIIITILVSAICALICEYGGFEALFQIFQNIFKSNKNMQLGIGVLVGIMDIATANNTVAIIIANPIAKKMADKYKIPNAKTASILDTFSCIFQCFIPYGAQMLVAISIAKNLGVNVTAFQIILNLFYPYLLLISSLIFIYIIKYKKGNSI